MGIKIKDAPNVIKIPFEYENSVKTEFYSLELPDVVVDRVELSGILTVIEEMDEPRQASVAKWVPSPHGWDVEWRIDGGAFLSRHKLEEIKCKQ